MGRRITPAAAARMICMYDIIASQPGIKPAQLSKEMEVSYHTILHDLISIEDFGLLLSEDTGGGLYVFQDRLADWV